MEKSAIRDCLILYLCRSNVGIELSWQGRKTLFALKVCERDPVEFGPTRGLLDYRYYQGLTVLQQHFPMGRKKEGILVEFPWYDAFQSNKRAVSDSVAYEKASVLFNLAAVCSQQSLANDLATDGGLKAAARHFQVCDTHLKPM